MSKRWAIRSCPRGPLYRGEHRWRTARVLVVENAGWRDARIELNSANGLGCPLIENRGVGRPFRDNGCPTGLRVGDRLIREMTDGREMFVQHTPIRGPLDPSDKSRSTFLSRSRDERSGIGCSGSPSQPVNMNTARTIAFQNAILVIFTLAARSFTADPHEHLQSYGSNEETERSRSCCTEMDESFPTEHVAREAVVTPSFEAPTDALAV